MNSIWDLPADPYVLQVQQVSAPREECSMCVRMQNPQLQDMPIFRVSSTHPSRRMVFFLCEFCKNEFIHQIHELEGDV